MKRFQYQIVRYVHDHFTGEFVNIGIIVYSKENHFLSCKMVSKYQRITQMFPDADGRWIIRILNYLEAQVRQKNNKFSELFSLPDHLDGITNDILANDNSAIQMSEIKLGLDLNLETALSDLFTHLVEKYLNRDVDNSWLSDEDIWKKKYKQYFEKFGIDSRLSSHQVIVPKDIIQFDRSWKNEIWHSYEPLSFELTKKERIKEKVYKWVGKIQALKQADEPLQISFLTSINPKHKELMSFVNENLNFEDEKLKVNVVTEDQAESFARQIKNKMDQHDSTS